MSLKQWADNGWLRPHRSSAMEIADLLGIVERDLADSTGEISADWRFAIAYNAALKLCTILLHASGYRPEKNLAHYRTLAALPLIFGPERKDDADYLDACRGKRNTAEYDMAGTVTMPDAGELVAFAKELKQDVLAWLGREHPRLLPKQCRTARNSLKAPSRSRTSTARQRGRSLYGMDIPPRCICGRCGGRWTRAGRCSLRRLRMIHRNALRNWWRCRGGATVARGNSLKHRCQTPTLPRHGHH